MNWVSFQNSNETSILNSNGLLRHFKGSPVRSETPSWVNIGTKCCWVACCSLESCWGKCLTLSFLLSGTSWENLRSHWMAWADGTRKTGNEDDLGKHLSSLNNLSFLSRFFYETWGIREETLLEHKRMFSQFFHKKNSEIFFQGTRFPQQRINSGKMELNSVSRCFLRDLFNEPRSDSERILVVKTISRFLVTRRENSLERKLLCHHHHHLGWYLCFHGDELNRSEANVCSSSFQWASLAPFRMDLCKKSIRRSPKHNKSYMSLVN